MKYIYNLFFRSVLLILIEFIILIIMLVYTKDIHWPNIANMPVTLIMSSMVVNYIFDGFSIEK